MMHYPPFPERGKTSEFMQLFEAYGVKKVIYGHIHGMAAMSDEYAEYEHNGVWYKLTSCDHLGFTPAIICS